MSRGIHATPIRSGAAGPIYTSHRGPSHPLPSGYKFISDRARNASEKYGVKSVSLLGIQS